MTIRRLVFPVIGVVLAIIVFPYNRFGAIVGFLGCLISGLLIRENDIQSVEITGSRYIREIREQEINLWAEGEENLPAMVWSAERFKKQKTYATDVCHFFILPQWMLFQILS